MNQQEFETYCAKRLRPAEIHIDELGAHARTLALGYTQGLEDWHAYVQGGEIHVVLYHAETGRLITHASGESLPVTYLQAHKRVYLDTVEVKFAELMRRADAPLGMPAPGRFDFTAPDVLERAQMRPFKGLTASQLQNHQ